MHIVLGASAPMAPYFWALSFVCADLLIGVLYRWLAGSLSVKLTWFRNILVPLSAMSGK